VSHYMTALAMKQQGLKPATKIVLYWLADHHNGETGLCFPSLNRLALLAEMDKSTVVRHIDTLATLGLVERVRSNREDGGYSSTHYVLKIGTPLSQNATSPCSKNAPPLVAKCNTNLGSNNLGNNNHTSSKDDEVNYYFDQLWEMYPRKVGKGQARKAYVAASKKIDFFDLLPKLEAYVSTLDGKDKQYMPHLATWLNGERWADEV
jgi:DNA-binding transcriptional ArsR family regulator